MAHKGISSSGDGAQELLDIEPKKATWDSETRYKLLLDVNNSIVNQNTREKLFWGLTRELRRIVDYDRFSISIYDPENNVLNWFAAADGISVKSMDGSSRSIDKGPVARSVITTLRPLLIPDMAEYRHWHTIRQMMAEGLTATMAFPLIVRNAPVGSINFSFRKKPDNLAELAGFLTELSGQVALAVDNMLSHSRLVALNADLEQQRDYLLRDVDPQYDPDNFYYSSPVMSEIMRQVDIVADSDVSVLLTGETGTGKDYIARYIHHRSRRRNAMFVKVNCPALSPSLFESELFGHAKGAFTGANAKRVGRFEMANGGTLFLDEIGELPMQLQAKLLHVLQDRRFERVGESQSLKVDFRVLAATNSELEQAIQTRHFRSDLYYRLNTVSFNIPPLRERAEEIVPLVRRLVEAQSRALHRAPPILSAEVLALLRRHPWPGNVRELRNILNRMIIIYSGRNVTRRNLEPLLNVKQHEVPSSTGPLTMAEVERAHLIKVLTLTKGRLSGKQGAAAVLGMPKSTLQYRLRKHGLTLRDYSGQRGGP
ncbi:sigma 54-interacting transcriptional regulator [Solidesulfovibrio sp.]|uniref:sigma-54-dependent Fis family transcriptional regulator n=1 Tax=Solidesulfovibrio sp. TaxID=2910990 RepID=UPI0026230BCF|nr:sigma 54-interacting transcriptional regulator [Solidesulfovibrio sp.]